MEKSDGQKNREQFRESTKRASWLCQGEGKMVGTAARAREEMNDDNWRAPGVYTVRDSGKNV